MHPERFDAGGYRAALLTREMGRTLHVHESVGSTNDMAMTAAAGGAPHGTVIVAEEQSEGRGRLGRSWTAPARAALLFSMVVRPEVAVAEGTPLTLVAGVALCETLRDLGLEAAEIKWPNDIRIGDRKVAGILCESRVLGHAPIGYVIGIGCNVNQSLEELPDGATSLLLETGGRIERGQLLAETLNRLEPWYARALSGRFEEVRAAFEVMSPLANGHRVRIDSDPPIAGLSEGIADDGALRVRTDSGALVLVRSGSAFFERRD